MTPIAALLFAAATAFADPAAIDQTVAEFTGAPLGTPGGAAQGVDRRLKLAACRNPLSLGWYAGRRDTVLVQCPDAAGWRLFVPLLQNALAPAQAAPAILRGEAVTILISGEGFTVFQPGQALDGGAVGSWIRVKNAASAGAEPVRARIVRPGLVRLDLGTDLP
ncbi:flagella basal body P-ring formation protein FlgA [Novosphingobium flavum]|uniref:Flagella basal body P-ring formation protein FlgA n=1 Tax=Novosphingobium flavum TaxID=1778672 RepID=A0A7X1KLV5_9SPHN|nr:flagella basal body P-ring formation protein FlgA [Novosphingobium flavum]MBC2665625.1 flagella basal body P-ring formation protein FlgA [Novosphingobium flavum]